MKSSWIKSSIQRFDWICDLCDFVLSTVLSQKMQKSDEKIWKNQCQFFELWQWC